MENYLTEHDLCQLLKDLPPFFAARDVLTAVLNHNYDKFHFIEDIDKIKLSYMEQINQQLQKNNKKIMPDFFKAIPLDLKIYPNSAGIDLKFSTHQFFLSCMYSILKGLEALKIGYRMDKDVDEFTSIIDDIFETDTEKYKELVQAKLTEIKNLLNHYLNDDYSCFVTTLKGKGVLKTLPEPQKEAILLLRNAAVWLHRNFDLLKTTFEQPISLNATEIFNQDQFLVLCFHYALSGLYYREDHKDLVPEKIEEEKLNYQYLPFINRYLLYYQYRNQKESYSPRYRYNFHDTNIHCTPEALYQDYLKILKIEPKIEKHIPNITFEDLLESDLTDLKNRLEFEEFNREILLGFELLPESIGQGISRGKGTYRGTKTEEERMLLEEKKEKLLAEKLDIFKGKKVAEYQGINHFEGYKAFLYPNGRVILEKFYKRKRSKAKKDGQFVYELEPVYNEAAYAMDMETFKKVARMTKGEVRDLKQTGVYPDITVINHTKNFRTRVMLEMERKTGSSYSKELLNYIDETIAAAKDEVKEYQK